MKPVKLFLIFSFLFLSACSFSKPSKVTGQQVPYTKFMTLDGQFLLTEELAGKTAVVIFWASWCGYSRPAIKEIDDFTTENSRAAQARYIAVSVDKSENFEKLKEVISSLKTDKIEYYFSGNDVYDEAYIEFDASLLPHIFIINPQGKVILASHDTDDLKDYFADNK